jgi:2-polyprenyl-6-hydroxyphenyl methylase/3-demethylubiquinone-9 3-methyltransferase
MANRLEEVTVDPVRASGKEELFMLNDEASKNLRTHFAFGRNWAGYSKWINQERIAHATADLRRLLGDDLVDKTMIDVGCGSGLHSLAALRLGARHVYAVDLDPEAVRTTREVLSRFRGGVGWSAEVRSVFDLDDQQRYDIVYSWGVLHHTGSMWEALDKVSRLVADQGLLALALYARTRYCSFWQSEKKFCSSLPRPAQLGVAALHAVASVVAALARSQNPVREIKEYRANRGMSWWHDRIDWVGGYPYESASPDEVIRFLGDRSFTVEMLFGVPRKPPRGLLGSGCVEYVFRRAR